MRITAEQVRGVAALARLGVAEEEIEELRAQLEAILGYVEQLTTLDLSEVEGTSHAIPLDCPTRTDEGRPSPLSGGILSQAPRREDDCFAVPRIIPSE